MLILRMLLHGPQHGQGVARAIQAQSDDVLTVEHGSLYPALQRLEARTFVSAEWKKVASAIMRVLDPKRA